MRYLSNKFHKKGKFEGSGWRESFAPCFVSLMDKAPRIRFPLTWEWISLLLSFGQLLLSHGQYQTK